MSVSNGLISAPINAADPYKCMGVAKYKGTYDVGYICGNEHDQINPHAKYKPVKWSKPNILLTEDDNWKGEDGLCGFSVPIYDSPDALLEGLRGGQQFTYNAPVPGTDYCRLTDFNGYKHNVPRGFFDEPNLQGTVQVRADGTVYLEVTASTTTDPLNPWVSFVDLSPLNPITGGNVNASDMYVGVWFYYDSTYQFRVVSDKKFGEMSDIIGITVPVDSSYIGKELTYYIFLCEDPDMGFDTVFMPTDIEPKKVKFIAYGTGTDVTLVINEAKGIQDEWGYFTLTYKNNSDTTVTFNGATGLLYDDADNLLASENILNSFSIAAGGTKTVEIEFLFDFSGVQDPDIENSYRFVVNTVPSSGNGYVMAEVLFERYPDGSWNGL